MIIWRLFIGLFLTNHPTTWSLSGSFCFFLMMILSGSPIPPTCRMIAFVRFLSHFKGDRVGTVLVNTSRKIWTLPRVVRFSDCKGPLNTKLGIPIEFPFWQGSYGKGATSVMSTHTGLRKSPSSKLPELICWWDDYRDYRCFFSGWSFGKGIATKQIIHHLPSNNTREMVPLSRKSFHHHPAEISEEEQG